MPEALLGTVNQNPPAAARWRRFQTPLAVAAIFAVTLVAYLPALEGGLLWDDASHITALRLQTWAGLYRIWFKLGTTQQYYPVLHSAFWLEHQLWGDSVLGYHLINLALHATAACLFGLVLGGLNPRKLGWPWAEWMAAAVFALHPVCAESVAWISEQKNTLSLVFYLLSALAYLRFDRVRRPSWYALAFVLFLLALLSKSVTATLPAALLLLIALRRGGLAFRRDGAPLIPWFVLGVSSGLFTAWVERNFIGARGEAFNLGFVERSLLAGRVVWFYLGKLLWPRNLVFIYPRWHVAASGSWFVGCLAVAVTLAVLWALRKWSPAPLVAFLFFVGSLFPALGFFNVYPFIFSYVADHFQYLPSLGIIGLVVAGGCRLAFGAIRRLSGPGRLAAQSVAGVAAAGVLSTLLVLTWRQSEHYRNSAALYEDTLAKNPDCWMADNNLGIYLMANGSLAASIAHLERAIQLKPDYSDAHNNLGNALMKVPGRAGEAVAQFEQALRLDPSMAQAHANLGLALVKTAASRAQGIEELRTALRSNEDNPDYAQAHADLGTALAAESGRMPEAIAEFEAAQRLDPGSAEIQDGFAVVLNDSGLALARAGRAQEAESEFERALRMRPENPEIHNNLGGSLAILGRGPEAIAQFREAVRLNPNFAGAHFNLGRALRKMGDGQEAIAEHRTAERLSPDSAEIRSSLGSIFYRLGRVQEALAEYREAVRLQPNSAQYRFNLGVALSASGNDDEAIVQFGFAIQLEPGYADAHFNLGLALKRAGRDDEAEKEFAASGRR